MNFLCQCFSKEEKRKHPQGLSFREIGSKHHNATFHPSGEQPGRQVHPITPFVSEWVSKCGHFCALGRRCEAFSCWLRGCERTVRRTVRLEDSTAAGGHRCNLAHCAIVHLRCAGAFLKLFWTALCHPLDVSQHEEKCLTLNSVAQRN